MVEEHSLDLYKDFTPEEIKILVHQDSKRGKWKRTPEHNKKCSELRKAEWARKSEKERTAISEKRSQSMLEYWKALNPKGYEERCNQVKEIWSSYNSDERNKRMENTFLSPDKKERAAIGRRKHIENLTPEDLEEWVSRSFLSAEGKAKRSEAVTKVWASYTEEEKKLRLKESINNPESYSKSAKARVSGPSGPEMLLEEILNHNYPGKFGYNGDCRLGIKVGRRIPDFISLEGNKKAILVFGGLGYLHYIDDMEESRKFYNKEGWGILIIWDFEIYAGEVLLKLKEFID